MTAALQRSEQPIDDALTAIVRPRHGHRSPSPSAGVTGRCFPAACPLFGQFTLPSSLSSLAPSSATRAASKSSSTRSGLTVSPRTDTPPAQPYPPGATSLSHLASATASLLSPLSGRAERRLQGRHRTGPTRPRAQPPRTPPQSHLRLPTQQKGARITSAPQSTPTLPLCSPLTPLTPPSSSSLSPLYSRDTSRPPALRPARVCPFLLLVFSRVLPLLLFLLFHLPFVCCLSPAPLPQRAVCPPLPPVPPDLHPARHLHLFLLPPDPTPHPPDPLPRAARPPLLLRGAQRHRPAFGGYQGGGGEEGGGEAEGEGGG